MQPASLAGTVQDSKVKRQERLKSRFRDRGGIFVPTEGNPLVNILLARGINGDSPFKKRSLRKSVLTPKPPQSAASRVTQTKTPHTGARKSAARQPRPSQNEGNENCPPRSRKSRNTLKGRKQPQEDRRRDDMNPGTSAGPSRSRTPAPERIPFADELANAINAVKSPSVPHSRLGKVKTPQSKQAPDARVGQITPSVLHEEVGNDSDDSDVPLAKKFLKHGRALAGARTKLTQDKEDGPQPPKKRRPRAKAPGPANDPSNTATNPSKITEASRRKEQSVADFPPPPIAHGVDSGGGRKVQVLQEKTAPASGPQRRKQGVKSAKDESEHTQGPPRKKRRRADTATSHGKRENREMSRSAREVAKVAMAQPLPSPVKQPAARQKPASKAKPPSRARATKALHSRGPPPAVLRRIKINAQNLPALDQVDDDDPIDFLR